MGGLRPWSWAWLEVGLVNTIVDSVRDRVRLPVRIRQMLIDDESGFTFVN